MILARVIGEVVASQKHPSHQGQKLLRLMPEPLESADGEAQIALQASAPPGLIALDAVGAGIGELVLVVLDGYAAMTAVHRPRSPIDAAVIGIVDRADLAERPH